MCRAGVTVNRIAAAVLLAARAAHADVPGGHWYVGFEASPSKPLASDHSQVWGPPGDRVIPLRTDLALSLELAFEMRHAFVGISFERGGFYSAQPSFELASLRGGAIFGSGNVAPYVAAGAGHMSMSVGTPYDYTGTVVHASGLALTAEAGVLLLRERQFGRVAMALRLIDPLFGMQGPPYTAGGSRRIGYRSSCLRRGCSCDPRGRMLDHRSTHHPRIRPPIRSPEDRGKRRRGNRLKKVSFEPLRHAPCASPADTEQPSERNRKDAPAV